MDVRARRRPRPDQDSPGIGERRDGGGSALPVRSFAWLPDDCRAPVGESAPMHTPGRTGSMPRQRISYKKTTYELPEDFPQRLKRFQEESGLSWSEIARRLGIDPITINANGSGECAPITGI